jgi:hypothetical protein
VAMDLVRKKIPGAGLLKCDNCEVKEQGCTPEADLVVNVEQLRNMKCKI